MRGRATQHIRVFSRRLKQFIEPRGIFVKTLLPPVSSSFRRVYSESYAINGTGGKWHTQIAVKTWLESVQGHSTAVMEGT